MFSFSSRLFVSSSSNSLFKSLNSYRLLFNSYKLYKPFKNSHYKSFSLISLTSAPFFSNLWWHNLLHTPIGLTHDLPLRKVPSYENSKILLHYYNSNMKYLSHFMWLLMGGGLCCLLYFITGCICSLTYFGIPFAKKQFSLASLCLNPFDKDCIETKSGLYCFSIIFLPFKVVQCLFHLTFAGINYLSVFGIVFGDEHLRLAFISLYPHSKYIYNYKESRINNILNLENIKE